jgi:hypothetical protein
MLVALYASSINFLNTFGDLRPYFLIFSTSIVVCLVWRALMRGEPAGAVGRRPLLVWFIALAVFVNMHYFALLFGGLLTICLLVDRARQRRIGDALGIAAVSLLAAAPAIVIAAIQARYSMSSGTLNWYTPGLGPALGAVGTAVLNGSSFNIPAAACAVSALLLMAQNPGEGRAARDVLILVGAVLAFYAVLLVVNAIKPMIVDRYLIPASGAIVIVLAVFCGSTNAPKWAPVAACLCALGVQWSALLLNNLAREGWSEAAKIIALERTKCPSSTVYTVPFARVFDEPVWASPLSPNEFEGRRYGYRYYAAKYHFAIHELKPGDRVGAHGPCPSFIWIEHMSPPSDSIEDTLANLQIAITGKAEMEKTGSGVLVTVWD